MSTLPVLLDLALPTLLPGARPIVDVLVARGGCCRPADGLARALGFHNRHQLSRRLQQLGLPQLEELSSGIRALCLLAAYKRRVAPLPRLARADGRAPESDYRLIQRITGHCWRELQLLPPELVAFELGYRWRSHGERAGNDDNSLLTLRA